MPKYQVQQFQEADDDFHELGGLQTLDVTEAEVTQLRATDGEVVWLESRRGYFGLASEEPVEN